MAANTYSPTLISVISSKKEKLDRLTQSSHLAKAGIYSVILP